MTEKKLHYYLSGNKTEKKSQSRNCKDKQIITKYNNGQPNWAKRAHLFRSETSLW